jgi:hypothetical protein
MPILIDIEKPMNSQEMELLGEGLQRYFSICTLLHVQVSQYLNRV